MGLMKPRVSSYVDRGNELIAKGKTKQAMNLVSHGLQYYSERVIDSMGEAGRSRRRDSYSCLERSWHSETCAGRWKRKTGQCEAGAGCV